MKKRVLLSVILSSLFLYSSVASACAYCYGYHDRAQSNYSNNYSNLVRSFEDKRYELNKLYDQGVKETDDKAQTLIKDLDSLSNQIQTERDNNRSYRHNRYQDDRNHNRGYHNNRCW
ncbi:hypothetical protein [Proteus sp. ZN5]|uniref:hypothetical protein n=1 Tax=Proteus sp. ZN5 TaxID=2697019 RepID=UPI0013E1B4C2|nr:hypothetical protein [Proteus sp. ZN5]QIG06160.1 hypothetical protein GTK47_12830 [Proteus sp. ZN5]